MKTGQIVHNKLFMKFNARCAFLKESSHGISQKTGRACYSEKLSVLTKDFNLVNSKEKATRSESRVQHVRAARKSRRPTQGEGRNCVTKEVPSMNESGRSLFTTVTSSGTTFNLRQGTCAQLSTNCILHKRYNSQWIKTL